MERTVCKENKAASCLTSKHRSAGTRAPADDTHRPPWGHLGQGSRRGGPGSRKGRGAWAWAPGVPRNWHVLCASLQRSEPGTRSYCRGAAQGPPTGKAHAPCKQRPSRQGPQQLLPHWVCFSAGHQAEQRAREAQDPGLTSPRKHRAVSTEHQCPPTSHASWRREVSLLSPEVELRPAIAQGASERHSVRSPKPALPLLGGQTRAGPRHSEQIGL